MAEFSYIPINTTAEKLEKIANMEINEEKIDENSDNDSLPTSKVVYDAVKEFGGGEVDQDYNPDSENAQSGKAVAEAIKSIPSISITDISESTEDGGSNVVTFSDGKTLTVRNGSKGSTGEQGISGVYIGSGEMPDGYNVQIDPEGVTTEIGDIAAALDELHTYAQAIASGGAE